ncbi:MAG TPA: hypothetical protein VFY44_11880 [Thermoleophilaceae bacterium]|nr:hypothetical protein [Thermoleophilaceae bacterium]
MNARIPAVALAALALLALPMPASAAKHPRSAVREFTGTVASVSGKKKTFRLRRTGRAAIVVQLSRKTKVAKGAKPLKGRKLVVKARRAGKGRSWLARSVKLVPVAAEDEPAEDDVLDEEPVTEDEEGEDTDPVLDLEDTLGDLFGDDEGSDEEPE